MKIRFSSTIHMVIQLHPLQHEDYYHAVFESFALILLIRTVGSYGFVE